MDQEIKLCFTLYLNYMKSQIKNLKSYNIDDMTIAQIRIQLDVIQMQYIIGSFSISKTSIAYAGYIHLTQMIDSNYTIMKLGDFGDLENEIKNIKTENILLKQEIEILKNKIEILKNKAEPELEIVNIPEISRDIIQESATIEEQKKGWFFG